VKGLNKENSGKEGQTGEGEKEKKNDFELFESYMI